MKQSDFRFKKFRELKEVVLDVLINVDDATEFSVNSTITTSVEKAYYDICAIIIRVLCVKTTLSSTSDISATVSVLSLPKFEWPKFNGSLIQWRPFRKKLVSLIR